MVKRPTIHRMRPRQFRISDIYYAPIGQDLRPAGLALIAVSLTLFLLLEVDLTREPLIPTAIAALGLIGVVVVARAPLWRTRDTLMELNLSTGVVSLPFEGHNGSGATTQEIEVRDVDELLFAMRETPVDPDNPRSIRIDTFGLHLRTFDGELLAVVEASLDHDRTFRVARFLSEALNVGIKQVGKGWK